METLTDATVQAVEASFIQIVTVTACMLEQLCVCEAESSTPCTSPRQNSVSDEAYRSPHCPDISVLDYCKRLKEYCGCHASTWIISMLYLDRWSLKTSNRTGYLTVHRLLLTSLVIAIKRWEDNFYSNAFLAKVGGIETKELNKLELEFLFTVDWELDVSPAQFDQYFSQIQYLTSSSSTDSTSCETETEQQESTSCETETEQQEISDLPERLNPSPINGSMPEEFHEDSELGESLHSTHADSELVESFHSTHANSEQGSYETKFNELYLSDSEDPLGTPQFSMPNFSPHFGYSLNTPPMLHSLHSPPMFHSSSPMLDLRSPTLHSSFSLSANSPSQYNTPNLYSAYENPYSRSLYNSTPKNPYSAYERHDVGFRACGDDDFSNSIEKTLPFIY